MRSFFFGLSLVLASSAVGQTVIKVTPAAPNGWNFGVGTTGVTNVPTAMTILGAGTHSSIRGPGALWLLTGSGSPMTSVAYAWKMLPVGTRLASVTNLRYSMFIFSGSVLATEADRRHAIYLNLWLDTNGDGSVDSHLCFEPRFNGTWSPDEWRTWIASKGKWWYEKEPELLLTLSEWRTRRVELRNAHVITMGFSMGVDWSSPQWHNKLTALDNILISFDNQPYVVYDFEGGR